MNARHTASPSPTTILKNPNHPPTYTTYLTSNNHTNSYLDLHELHREFTNAKFGRPLGYVEYLGALADFADVPRALKLGAPYW
jgi:hypothetical protein